MKSILDPTFQYIPSVETDIRKTFARIRREQRKEQDRLAEQNANVLRNFENRRAAAKKT